MPAWVSPTWDYFPKIQYLYIKNCCFLLLEKLSYETKYNHNVMPRHENIKLSYLCFKIFSLTFCELSTCSFIIHCLCSNPVFRMLRILPVFYTIRELEDLVYIWIWVIYLVLERLVLRQRQHLADTTETWARGAMPGCEQIGIVASIPERK